MHTRSQVNILLVEDDEVDVRVARRAFKSLGLDQFLKVASDGIIALEILREGKISWPWIILLDLNMPRMGGLQFLDVVRADEKLMKSIVFILTTSNDDRDKNAAFKRNVAGYLLKQNINDRQHAALISHYLSSVEFPPFDMVTISQEKV